MSMSDTPKVALSDAGGFAPGALLGPYRILRRIGVGGMGMVYEAEHTMLRQHFAVKALTLEGLDVAARKESAERFLLEARVTSRMRHAGIVSVQTLEVDAETGTLYFVMEYVAMSPVRREALVASALGDATVWRTPAPPPETEGQEALSLEDLLQASKARGRRINPSLVRRLLLDVCSALAYAHTFGEGVLHRDIKPANILVRPNGRAVVADFGVAKVLGEAFRKEVLRHQDRSLSLRIEADGRLSRMVPGTEAYMAPELLAGGEPTPKTDLYALGVMAYQLLTGERFSADSLAPSALGLPKAWDLLILGCLRADPANRWADIPAFRRALAALPRRQAMACLRRVALWGMGAVSLGALAAGGLWGTLGRERLPEMCPPAEGLWVPRVRQGLFLRFERVPGGVRLVRVHPDHCGHLTLAETYRGQPLVAVREGAFRGCEHLTGVSAPKGIDLPPLDGARLSPPEPIPNLTVVAGAQGRAEPFVPMEASAETLFATRTEADGLAVVGLRTRQTMPLRLKVPASIGGKPVRALASAAFRGLPMTSVELPEGLERLGERVFENCAHLTKIRFPASIRWERFGQRWLLRGCAALRAVEFGSQPPAFAKEMFAGCRALERVTLPGDARPEEVENPFGDVSMNARLVLLGSGEELAVRGSGSGRIVEGTAVYRLMPGRKSYAFQLNPWDWNQRREVTSFTVPRVFRGLPVTQLDHLAFAGCTRLESLTLPDTLVEMGVAPFRDCAALQRVEIPAGVRGGLPATGVFRGCAKLREVIFGTAPEVLPRGTFAGCGELARLVFRSGVLPRMEPGAFGVSPAAIDVVASDGRHLKANDLPCSAQAVGGVFLVGTEGGWEVVAPAPEAGKSLTVPAMWQGKPVVSVAEGAFREDTHVEEIKLPASVRAIGAQAFYGSAVKRVTLPETLRFIGESAFQNSRLEETPRLPDSVETIEGRVVTGCTFRDGGVLRLPKTLRTVPVYFGWWATGLSGMELPGVEEVPPLGLVYVGAGAPGGHFNLRFGRRRVRFRKESLSLHPKATYVVMTLCFPEGSEPVFEEGALSGTASVELRIEGQPVRHWDGKGWVQGALALPSQAAEGWITEALPDGKLRLTGVRDKRMKAVKVPTAIDGRPLVAFHNGALAGCRDAQTLSLPETLETMAPGALLGMESLREVTFPKSIRWERFNAAWLLQWCKRLEEVTLLSAPKRFGAWMFEGCARLRKVSIAGDRLPEMGRESFKSTRPEGVEIVLLGSGERFLAKDGAIVPLSRESEVPLEGCPGAVGSVRLEADGTHRLVGVRGLREGCGFTLPSEIACVAKGAFAGCPRGLRIRLARADVFFEPDAFDKVAPAVIAFPMGQPPLFTRRSFPWVPAFWEDGAEVRLLTDVGDVRYLRAREGVYAYAVRNVRYGVALTLPKSLGTRPVLGILPHAFMPQTNLRRVIVEGDSARLWPKAFEGVPTLREIVTDANISEETLRTDSDNPNLVLRRLGKNRKER